MRTLARILTAIGLWQAAVVDEGRTVRDRSAPRILHAVSFNAKVGRRPKVVVGALEEFLRAEHWPHVVCLQEAGGYVAELRAQLGDRYRVYAPSGWSEASNNPVLVLRGLYVPRWTWIRMHLAWTGPKAGKRHPGRTWTVVDLGAGDHTVVKWRIVNVHRVPGGPDGGVHMNNENAWREEHIALWRFAELKGSRRRALAIIGDENCQTSDPHPLSVGGLADAIGARIIRTGAKVDWAIIRGAVGTGRKRVEDLGSDHPVVTYRLMHGEAHQ